MIVLEVLSLIQLLLQLFKRVFDLYLQGKTYLQIVTIFNNENILNKKWRDFYIEKIINNKVYMGDWEEYKSIGKKRT